MRTELGLNEFLPHDLNRGMPDLDAGEFDVALLLDVVEHLYDPEAFVRELGKSLKSAPNVRVLVSTGNVAFIIIRMMLLLGQFNYGKRGILDLTHARLFTFGSLRGLFEQNGFRVLESRGLPAPFPIVVTGRWGRYLVRINEALIALSKRMFSYQIFMAVQPLPSLDYLLASAQTHAVEREGSKQ